MPRKMKPAHDPRFVERETNVIKEVLHALVISDFALSCGKVMKEKRELLWTKLLVKDRERFGLRTTEEHSTLIPCKIISTIVDDDHAGIRIESSSIHEMAEAVWQVHGVEWRAYLHGVTEALFRLVEARFEGQVPPRRISSRRKKRQ